MANIDPQQGLMPSILDRLIDPDTAGTEAQRGYNLAQMMEAVREDLEELLNTRQTLTPLAKSKPRLHGSILGYGLPDLTSFSTTTPEQRKQITQVLEATVARFEPRLRDVHVSLLNTEDEKQPTLRFHIVARLAVEPAPEVGFETVVESTGRHSVQHVARPQES
jgi:type VI secretion system protein ImpF